MKACFLLLVSLVSGSVATAGESALTMTCQPLSGLGAGTIVICPVPCHDWYAHGSATTAIGLISARNVPPTNNPERAQADLNYASTYGIRFRTNDIGGAGVVPAMTLDLTEFAVPGPGQAGQPKEDVLRASLECLRRCLIADLKKTPLGLEAADAVKSWAGPIVREFNEHDRREVFYTPPR